MIWEKRLQFNPSVRLSKHFPAAKYSCATLIQSVATAVLHYLFQQAPYGPYVLRQNIELRELSLRQSLPSHGSLRDVAETEE
jgi:hypothetical protein